MKKLFRIGSKGTTVVLFLLAVGLLVTGSIGGARAALTYYSETYSSRVSMYDIGVTLNENGTGVSWRNYESDSDGVWSETTGKLCENLLAEGESLKLGKSYDEVLDVTNSGTIDEFVRVSIYKYWLDEDGNKMTDLSPDWIDLNTVNVGSSWILDESASTDERSVYYYSSVLASGATTAPLTDTLTINGDLARKCSTHVLESGEEGYKEGYTTTVLTYDYDGVTFQIEAEVDAVQTHNAEDAIMSAWGRSVAVSGSSLSLG